MARESIVAHLVKLAREGRAGRRGEAWHIIGP
jgi:beta-lactamase-like protein